MVFSFSSCRKAVVVELESHERWDSNYANGGKLRRNSLSFGDEGIATAGSPINVAPSRPEGL